MVQSVSQRPLFNVTLTLAILFAFFSDTCVSAPDGQRVSVPAPQTPSGTPTPVNISELPWNFNEDMSEYTANSISEKISNDCPEGEVRDINNRCRKSDDSMTYY